MTTIRFFVPERPFVKQRPQFGRGRAWTPAETAAAEQAVRHYARRALPDGFAPFEGPVRLTLEFRFARAARQSKATLACPWHTFKNDLDNLTKLVLDSLNKFVFVDDGQVAVLNSSKRWADGAAGAAEGTTVTVEELDAGGVVE